MGIADPWVVRLDDARAELWINFFRLGDPHHTQGIEAL